MLTLRPVANRVLARLGLTRTLETASVDSWVLAPGCERLVRPTFYEASDLHKIVGVPDDSTLNLQLERITQGSRYHGPTRAFLLQDALMVSGNIFGRRFFERISGAETPWVTASPKVDFARGVLASTHYGNIYFAHWLLDDIPLVMAGEPLGTCLTVPSRPTAHKRDYLALFQMQTDSVSDAHFQELIVIDDLGQNAHKAARIHELRRRLRQHRTTTSAHGVFLMRKDSGARRVLSNEADLAEKLHRRGFRIIYPEESTLDEVLDATLGASIAIGVEGSQLAHAIVGVQDGGSILALQPPDRFNNLFNDFCDNIGLNYGFVVGEQEPNGAFSISESKLLRLVDRMLSASG